MTGLPARPRPGARLASWLLVAGLAGGVPPKAYGATTDLPFGPLPWRVGGDVGFTVDAAAFPDSSGCTLEIYVRLAPATLMAVTGGRPQGGPFSLALRSGMPTAVWSTAWSRTSSHRAAIPPEASARS